MGQAKRRWLSCSAWWLAVMALHGLVHVGATAAALPEAVSSCLQCHGVEGLSMLLADGSQMSLYEDGDKFAASVHGRELVCTDCHEGYDSDHPHSTRIATRRDYELSSYEICKRCHFDTYTRTLESVHYEFLRMGSKSVPVCTDCHGAHYIHDPHEKRAMLSRSCASCHSEIYQSYAQSVHGKALVAEGNQDVPACADCHTAHRIADPRTVKFRLASPETCIRCHGDEALMRRYQIPTAVATTYLADFHRVTAALARPGEVEKRRLVVTCIDCHGVHTIMSPDLVGRERMKESLVHVCARCHPGAGVDFPTAWLSHFRPSLEHAPLVFLVDRFYKVFIPFVTVGLGLQVMLHLYRVAVRR